MIKQRLWIWILFFAIVWGGKYLINWITTPQPEINIQYSIAENPELSDIKNVNVGGIKETYNLKNPQVILTTKDLDNKDFNKNEDIWLSPFVLYTGDHALVDKSGFTVSDLDSSLSYRTAKKDLSIILLAMEKDKTWQDIGIVNTCLEGKIKLHIPDKNSPFYPYVEKLFLMNLNEEVTEENFDILMQRVDKLISKCIQVENVESFINNTKNENKNMKIAVIAPEYIIANNYSTFNGEHSSSKQKTIIPVYLTKTTAIKYHLYSKNDLDENISQKIIDKYSSKKILTETGLRPLYQNVNIESLNSHCITDINIYDFSDIIEQKLSTYEHIVSDSATTVESETVIEDNTETKEEEDSLSGGEIFLIIFACFLAALLIICLFCWLASL